MARHQTAPAAITTPTPTPPAPTQTSTAPPPPPPRRVPPPPAPPPRSTSRPNLTSSPAKEPVPLANSSPVDKDEDEGFVTPRTSLEKADPLKDADAKPAAPEGAVVLNDEPTPFPEKKSDEAAPDAGSTTPVAAPAPVRPPRASSPLRRPTTPSSTALPPSAPTTPNREQASTPSATNTPNAAAASPSAPPPLPRRAASRKIVPNRSPRTSVLILGKEKDAFNDKERRNSIGQMMADTAPVEDLRRASLEGKTSSRPGTPSNDRPSSPSPSLSRPVSPLRTIKRSSLSIAPAEISPLTTSPAEDKPKAEESAPPPPAEAKPKAEEAAAPPALPPREHDAPPVPSKQQDGEADAKTVEEDDRVTVTDRTWEDRAWKELTRLKLEMFWARVGGIQVPSS